MSEERQKSLNIFADNILKLAIAALVSVLTWIGAGLQEKVARMENDLGSMKVQIAELRIEIRHLGSSMEINRGQK